MTTDSLLSQLDTLNEAQLRRLLVEHLTQQKLGLYWEASAIERDRALNANLVLPRLVEAASHRPDAAAPSRNLIIEGDNYDALRLLRSTHRGKIRVIYIDPPYNTGNKDWVYNDRFVGANDRWRHSQWLEFLYRRLSLARDLLTPDGVILVSINDENRARLELLMDEVFPGMRLGTMTWRTRQGSNADQQCFLSVDHEHMLVYGREGFSFKGFEKVVRGEHKHYFHPDFMVCLSHVPGDDSTMRLIETKENVKDAERKARRVPKLYGKVLFLTKDQSRLRIINDDGSLGLTVNWDDLSPVREWLRASKPTMQ